MLRAVATREVALGEAVSVLTERYTRAVDLARTLHTETRKGTTIPYLTHLLSVSALVLEHGGSEDQAIAALLHDAAEDQRPGRDARQLVLASCAR